VPDAVAEGPQVSAASEGSVLTTLAPQVSGLFYSAVALDLEAIEGAVDAFFARLDGLADSVAATGAPRLFPWLLAAVLAVGAWEVVRRRSSLSPPDAADGPSWAPFPVLAVLAPEDSL
jgi:hypothetical protein